MALWVGSLDEIPRPNVRLVQFMDPAVIDSATGSLCTPVFALLFIFLGRY